MPSLDELRYFSEVAKSGNVTRAAELCGISQSAVSHALKRLEKELGVELLFREKSGVRLTRAGAQFLIEIKEVIEKWETVARGIKASENQVHGHFKIGCHPSVAIYSLPHFLPALLSENPNLEVSLHHGRSREVANDIIEWRLDFGIVINPPEHPDLVIKELARDQVNLWAPKALRSSDTIILESGLFQTQTLLLQLEKRKIKFNRKIESSNLEVIRALVINGCGVGILPTRVAEAGPEKLRVYSKLLIPVEDRLCLVYRAGIQRSPASRTIIDAVMRSKI